jgi:hypothetical protein
MFQHVANILLYIIHQTKLTTRPEGVSSKDRHDQWRRMTAKEKEEFGEKTREVRARPTLVEECEHTVVHLAGTPLVLVQANAQEVDAGEGQEGTKGHLKHVLFVQPSIRCPVVPLPTTEPFQASYPAAAGSIAHMQYMLMHNGRRKDVEEVKDTKHKKKKGSKDSLCRLLQLTAFAGYTV